MVSTIHVVVAGLASVPPEVVARTAKVCEPLLSDPYAAGLEHVANAAPSSAHSNVAVDVVAWNARFAVVDEVWGAGPLSITVSGAPPAKSYVVTSKAWPSELVGATVTLVPLTVTLRKWYTWAAEVGVVAAPHRYPLLFEADQPI